MMILANKRVAVLEGGPGTEREVSLRSGANVAQGVRAAGAAEVTEVDVRDLGFVLPPGTDLVFNVVHGELGEDGQLPAELTRRGVTFTGEGVAGSRLAFDKILSKERFAARGIPTPEYEVIAAGELPRLPLPLVLKAPRQGSSVGVCLVRQPAELAPALAEVARYDQRILVERLVDGLELTVGILGSEALPIIWIRPREGFYDFKNKYPWLNPAGAADHECPAPFSPGLTARVQEVALAAHRALDLQTYSRVDLLLAGTGPDRAGGTPFVLEVNTIPGMTESSLLPEAAKAAGLALPQLCSRLAELSLLARPL